MRIFPLLLFCCLFAFPALAEDYAKPTWPNLLQTLVRFNAINIDDDNVLDEYGAVTECDLYKADYRDDFKWNKVRTALRDDIRQKITTFPTSYSYRAELQLDRYDFQEKLFRLTAKTTLQNINALSIYKVVGNPCEGVSIKLLPSAFRVVLDMPLFFEGIPLGQKDAEALLQQMKDDKNSDRIVSAIFNMRIVYIEPMHMAKGSDASSIYVQGSGSDDRSVRLDARLDSVEFYEDAALTKLIYRLQP